MFTSLSRLEQFLTKSRYVSGDTLTVADISIIPTITLLDVAVKLDFSRFPNIIRWMQTMQSELPYFDEFNSFVMQPFRDTVRQIQLQDF
jgi:glutathione S-transferase